MPDEAWLAAWVHMLSCQWTPQNWQLDQLCFTDITLSLSLLSLLLDISPDKPLSSDCILGAELCMD